MAFTNQFALSLELTKFVPGASLVNLAGRGLIHLMRELQNSGSDFITEGDLAEIFGRNRIESKFASTFRNAVKHSVIHQVANFAELVIEAGAGPTVRRSLNEPSYFSTIIQLSLLTWAHDLSTLAGSLAQILERRAKDSEDHVVPPVFDALKGTLRACREQTSGFMWELFFAAVEKKLDVGKPYDSRPLPIPVLQALLDSFTAVQHLPESTLVRIKTTLGVTTVVVWAHCVLGLAVVVETYEGAVRFGDGPESVYIDTRGTDEPRFVEASLFNETQDLLFNVVESNQDAILEPVCRHPILGYGRRIIELTLSDDASISREIIHTIITSCLRLVQEEKATRASTNIGRPGKDFCPSIRDVIAVARRLFPNNDEIFDGLDISIEQPCLARSDWKTVSLPPAIARSSKPFACRGLVLRLAHVVFVFSMVENMDNCEGLPLELYPDTDPSKIHDGSANEPHTLFSGTLKNRHRPFRLPDANEAFNTIVTLLRGRTGHYGDGDDVRANDKTAVFSAWGWSLCLSSVICRDPSELKAGLAIFQGVPMRNGVRKRLVVDGFETSGVGPQTRESQKKSAAGVEAKANDNRIVAQPGDRVAVRSRRTKYEKTRYLIAVTDTAFEVAQVCTFEPLSDQLAVRASHSETKFSRQGFREMQNIYWRMVHLPLCEHAIQIDQTIVLPQETWAFEGFDEPLWELPARSSDTDSHQCQAAEWTICKEGSVHVGLVAGDSSARWALSSSLLYHWKLLNHDNVTSPTAFLRSVDCCFECAINGAKSQRGGHHVGLVM